MFETGDVGVAYAAVMIHIVRYDTELDSKIRIRTYFERERNHDTINISKAIHLTHIESEITKRSIKSTHKLAFLYLLYIPA